MGRGTSPGGSAAQKAEKALLDKYSNKYLQALRVQDIKPGDSMYDDMISDGGSKKTITWTFHPEGYETYKGYSMSDIKITDVKVTAKTVKVTGLFDKANLKEHPKKEDYGKDTIKVTHTFKIDDIAFKRKKNK